MADAGLQSGENHAPVAPSGTEPRVPRVRLAALVLWVVGVQAHEIVATVGLALLVLSFVPAGVRHLRAGTLEPALRPWRVLVWFIGWALAGPAMSGHWPEGTGFARLFDWATIPLVAAAATQLTGRQWGVLTLSALGTLAISSVVAGLQHFGAWPPLAWFDSLAWMRLPFHRVYEPIGDSGRFMGGGLMFHRLKFAHVSGLVVVGAVVAASHFTGWLRAAVIALGLFGFISVWVFPYARMGAVAMTIAVGVTVVLVSRSRRKALLASAGLGLVGIIAVLAIAPLRERFASALTDQGSGQRAQHLAAGIEAVRQHPFTGIGVGQFRPSKFADASMAEHVKDNPGKAHNQFVSMAAETGVLGAVGFVGLLGWFATMARRRPYGALTQGAIALFGVLSLAHDPLFQAPMSMALVLCMGLGLRAAEDAPA